MADPQPASPPLSVLVLQLSRQKKARVLSLALVMLIVAVGAGRIFTSEYLLEFFEGFVLWCLAGVLVVVVVRGETRRIASTQDQIAVAQAALPPGNGPTGLESNLGLWLTAIVGLLGVAATIVAALIGKS